MAETKFKITLNETGQSITKEVLGYKISFFNHKWSYDKEGKETINKAELSETVYFHTEITGLPNKTQLKFKLYDYDNFLRDGLDDDEFNEEEVIVKTEVIEKGEIRKACIKLYLDQRWENMVKKDTAYDLDLYWQVHFKLPNYDTKLWAKVPKKTKDMLKVGFSKRDLYFNPIIAGHNLPEFVAYDGSPMVFIEFAKSFGVKQVKKKAKGFIKNGGVDKVISNIALAKLEKGMLINTQGNIITRNSQIYGKNFYSNNGELLQKGVYTNDSKLLENVKIRKNTGNKYTSTKPISQYDYFSKTGKRVTFLRTLKKAGSVYDFFGVASFMADEEATSKQLPIPLGPMSPLTNITNLITQENEAIFKEFFNEVVDQELLKAKSEGLSAVKKYIESWKRRENFQDYYEKGFEWRLMAISNETANKLLNGEFITFEGLNDYNEENTDYDDKIFVLYKEKLNTSKNKYDYIIETIFLNE
ncbi:hypothetical protein C7448_102495 [Tenacibaculum gallaicum]|uniref:Uncharacterized protein n=1 Tax=Tenacibaculum gallaicum TaxID=561505 RepID=A0A3E0I8B4_9FLAO|nr:hypothetical protein [Tenacibaculum gallaicum]REH54962.1 hypothetical protein C7448_102495 [Tenacibaculum gallaicum]